MAFGTRPEIIKLAEVVRLLGYAATLVHTGQHYDTALDGNIAAELGLPATTLRLSIGGASRGAQIGESTRLLDQHFASAPPRAVIVQGDTNSTVAAALAANARRLPLVHVEAGLRSFDRGLPEEHNRVITDHLADLCCAPTETARANLAAEGILGPRVVVTGNTVVDAVMANLPASSQRQAHLRRWDVESGSFAVATFHRESNVDDPDALEQILAELAALPLPVVFPVHPRTAARAERFGLAPLLRKLRTSAPVGYGELLGLIAECAFAVTDSGGIQEEASVVKRPVLVVRPSTERPEVVGTFAELVAPGPAMGAVLRAWLDDLPALHERLAAIPTPYGDGFASEQVVLATAALLAAGRSVTGNAPALGLGPQGRAVAPQVPEEPS